MLNLCEVFEVGNKAIDQLVLRQVLFDLVVANELLRTTFALGAEGSLIANLHTLKDSSDLASFARVTCGTATSDAEMYK